jgi:hypothetical protein
VIRTRPRIAIAALVALLLVGIATVEVHHRTMHGHWIAYGWHVDLASERVNSDIPGVERRWYAVVTNFALLPSSVDACMIPNDVQPHELPFYPFRIQVSTTATGRWRTVRPDLRLDCEPDRVERRTIWPLRSFATERISPAETGGFRERDWVRFAVYTTFDNRPGKRRVLVSLPFQFLYEWKGLVRTTLCELVKAPERFSEQWVQFEAAVDKGFERSVAVDRSCHAEIWLQTLDLYDPLTLDGLYTGMNEHSSDSKYDVIASLVGKFQHVNSGGVSFGHGLGHLGQWSSQLVLKSVSFVAAKPIDRAATEKGGR